MAKRFYHGSEQERAKEKTKLNQHIESVYDSLRKSKGNNIQIMNWIREAKSVGDDYSKLGLPDMAGYAYLMALGYLNGRFPSKYEKYRESLERRIEQVDRESKKRNRVKNVIDRRIFLIAGVLGLVVSLFFLSSNLTRNMTGNVIGNLPNLTSKIIGVILFAAGLVATFFWAKR